MLFKNTETNLAGFFFLAKTNGNVEFWGDGQKSSDSQYEWQYPHKWVPAVILFLVFVSDRINLDLLKISE